MKLRVEQEMDRLIRQLKKDQSNNGSWEYSFETGISTDAYMIIAWALDALIAASNQLTPEINKGIAYLLKASKQDDWTHSYPVGQGMGGGFYIHYHSYQYIFPLLALAHYKRKFTM